MKTPKPLLHCHIPDKHEITNSKIFSIHSSLMTFSEYITLFHISFPYIPKSKDTFTVTARLFTD